MLRMALEIGFVCDTGWTGLWAFKDYDGLAADLAISIIVIGPPVISIVAGSFENITNSVEVALPAME